MRLRESIFSLQLSPSLLGGFFYPNSKCRLRSVALTGTMLHLLTFLSTLETRSSKGPITAAGWGGDSFLSICCENTVWHHILSAGWSQMSNHKTYVIDIIIYNYIQMSGEFLKCHFGILGGRQFLCHFIWISQWFTDFFFYHFSCFMLITGTHDNRVSILLSIHYQNHCVCTYLCVSVLKLISHELKSKFVERMCLMTSSFTTAKEN